MWSPSKLDLTLFRALGPAATQDDAARGNVYRVGACERSWLKQYSAATTVQKRQFCNFIKRTLDGQGVIRAARRLDGAFDRHRGKSYTATHVTGMREVHDVVTIERCLIDELAILARMDPHALRRRWLNCEQLGSKNK